MVADLSFISLRIVLPALAGVASPDAAFVLLVKPQFEAATEGGGQWRRRPGSRGVGGACSRETVDAASTPTASRRSGFMASPVVGPAGNVEFLVHGRWRRPGRVTLDIDAAIAEGEGCAA